MFTGTAEEITETGAQKLDIVALINKENPPQLVSKDQLHHSSKAFVLKMLKTSKVHSKKCHKRQKFVPICVDVLFPADYNIFTCVGSLNIKGRAIELLLI